MSEMINKNLQNTNDCRDKISKETTELTKSIEFTQDIVTRNGLCPFLVTMLRPIRRRRRNKQC